MTPTTVILALAILALLLAALWLLVPRMLIALGLHPHSSRPTPDLSGRRALIVATSHGRLDPKDKPTGVWSSEMTVPFYAFADAGMEVDLASPRGGEIPIEKQSLRWPVASAEDRRFLADEEFRSAASDSIPVTEVDPGRYDAIFLAGGWGAAYDLGQSKELGSLVTDAYAGGAVVGGVCHGPLGLLQARTADERPLVEGRAVSAVTDKQLEELGITFTPLHPERELRAAGAKFESATKFRDLFATHVAVDERLVTGQNQNSGAETAHRMMGLIDPMHSAVAS